MTQTDNTTLNKIVKTIQSGVCPPHNFIKVDMQWAKCSYCGMIKPIYNLKIK